MDFDQAEREFRRLEEMRSIGQISEDEYRGRLSGLRVTDSSGQVWMIQERTGQWYVYYGNQWMPATPPGRQPTAAPTAPTYAAAQEKGGGCGKMALWLGVWAVIWIIIAVVVYVLAAKEEPQALLGVAAAALLSLVLMLANLNSQWSGQVTDIRVERERVSDDDDGGWHYRNVTYAYVRRSNGKVKKMRAMPGWQVGDRLEKRRGDASVRKL